MIISLWILKFLIKLISHTIRLYSIDDRIYQCFCDVLCRASVSYRDMSNLCSFMCRAVPTFQKIRHKMIKVWVQNNIVSFRIVVSYCTRIVSFCVVLNYNRHKFRTLDALSRYENAVSRYYVRGCELSGFAPVWWEFFFRYSITILSDLKFLVLISLNMINRQINRRKSN
jgi:hypothetical protein